MKLSCACTAASCGTLNSRIRGSVAEAISLASNSGRVQLLIVWNVDFTRFDANDPQGGYAIIRPGGGCPACDAIANAR